MENKNCKHCQALIPAKAKVCPNCKKSQGLSGCAVAAIVVGVLLLIIILLFSACAKGINDAVDEVNESFEETENSYKDKNGKTSFAKGETFENSYIKMTLTEVNTNFTDYDQWTSIKNGYQIVMVKFEAENIGKEDQFISYLDFNCYADDVAMEENYFTNADYESLSATISTGKKTSGYIFYEVPKGAEKIVLEYEPSWIEDVKIEFVIK